MTFPLSYSLECADEAQKLINLYGFVHNNKSLPRLHLVPHALQLLSQDFTPIYVDFTDNAILRRVQQIKNQGLIKACKPHKGIKIIDATAGFGRDAFMLASLGAEVTMLERSEVLIALLQDGLARLGRETYEFGNLHLINAESVEYLTDLKLEDFPDIIYLDPMHPVRKKKALVKKEMQVLQTILGYDADVKLLLDTAIARCKQYVVLKWPQREPPLLKPHHSIPGKTVRFDVYYP